MGKLFPIIDSERFRSIPWGLIKNHEDQAQTNHDQTLIRLAERGGLDPCETYCVLNDKTWREVFGGFELRGLMAGTRTGICKEITKCEDWIFRQLVFSQSDPDIGKYLRNQNE